MSAANMAYALVVHSHLCMLIFYCLPSFSSFYCLPSFSFLTLLLIPHLLLRRTDCPWPTLLGAYLCDNFLHSRVCGFYSNA